MHQRLAGALESRVRCDVVQQYDTIGPDGGNSGYPLTLNSNKNSMSGDPLPMLSAVLLPSHIDSVAGSPLWSSSHNSCIDRRTTSIAWPASAIRAGLTCMLMHLAASVARTSAAICGLAVPAYRCAHAGYARSGVKRAANGVTPGFAPGHETLHIHLHKVSFFNTLRN